VLPLLTRSLHSEVFLLRHLDPQPLFDARAPLISLELLSRLCLLPPQVLLKAEEHDVAVVEVEDKGGEEGEEGVDSEPVDLAGRLTVISALLSAQSLLNLQLERLEEEEEGEEEG